MASINSALVSTEGEPDELIIIDAPPSDAPRDQAVGDPNAPAGPGSGLGGGIGTGPPSATPRVGIASTISEKTSLPSVQVVPQVSGLSDLPAAASIDLGGGGGIAGDVAYETSDVGVALDQLAREILRHLTQHKLTVVWLFDESGSMKDDQRAIRQKFDRVASELKVHTEAGAGQGQEVVRCAEPRDRRVRQGPALRAGEADLRHRRDRPRHRSPPDRRHRGREHDGGDPGGDRQLRVADPQGPPAPARAGDRRVGRRRRQDRGGPPGGRQPGGADLRHRPAVALRLRPGPPAATSTR